MKKLLGFALVVAAGCGTDSMPPSDVLSNLNVPSPPEAGKGWQVITPIVEDIQPSSDVEMCTWTNIITDKPVDIRSTIGYQSEPPGHHIVAFYTTVKQPPGTQKVCADSDMATFRFLSGAGGEGIPNEAPGNLVYRMPAGAQLVINHHYLNSTDQTLRGQSALNINFADPTGTYVPSGNTAFLDTSIQIPAGTQSWDVHCAIPKPMKLWYFIPHMHQWGKHITVSLTQGGQKTTPFDNVAWDPSYAFHPPELRVDPSTPMTVNTGDSVDVHCEWNNDSGKTLSFGFEMCVAFGQFVDDQGIGNLACDGGHWGAF